jgi:pimeloyl-ACP methyl ester carboxylesterase
MTKIGIIGSGNIGGALTRLFTKAEHEVDVANSRGPDSLGNLARETDPAASAPSAAAGRGTSAAGRGHSRWRRQAIDVRGLLAALQAPTKIVVGVEDRVTPVIMPRERPHRTALVRHISHIPHLEARREVARLIEEQVRAGAVA